MRVHGLVSVLFAAAFWLLSVPGCALKAEGIAVMGVEGDGGGDNDALGAADRPPIADGARPPVETGPNPKENGLPCTAGEECASTYCTDGVCCGRACGGVCEVCNLEGSKGTCTLVPGVPRNGRPPCLGIGTACGGGCDGVDGDACHYPGMETECVPASCAEGKATSHSVCSGGGVCLPGVAVTCAPFSCAGAACAGECSAALPCQAGNYCASGKCLPLQGNGTSCVDGFQCGSGACVDARCCASPSCGSCEACTGAAGTCAKVVNAADPGTCTGNQSCSPDGVCKKKNGQACGSTAECLSGFCADGFCCTTSCTGACRSCKLGGSVGTCKTIPFTTDEGNCGGCAIKCSTNHVAALCTGGHCVGACRAGFLDCDGNKQANGCETSINDDPQNCGGCGNVCLGSCVGGLCELLPP